MKPTGGLRRQRAAGARHVTVLGIALAPSPLPQVSCLARLPNASRPATGRVPTRAALKPLVHGLASVVDVERARLGAVGERAQEVGNLAPASCPPPRQRPGRSGRSLAWCRQESSITKSTCSSAWRTRRRCCCGCSRAATRASSSCASPSSSPSNWGSRQRPPAEAVPRASSNLHWRSVLTNL